MKLLLLFFLHHLADVSGQPSWLIRNKKKYLWAIHEHVMVWTGFISIGLFFLGLLTWWKIIFLYVLHFAIDWFFYQLLPRFRRKEYWWVIPDQILHYIQLLVVYFF